MVFNIRMGVIIQKLYLNYKKDIWEQFYYICRMTGIERFNVTMSMVYICINIHSKMLWGVGKDGGYFYFLLLYIIPIVLFYYSSYHFGQFLPVHFLLYT